MRRAIQASYVSLEIGNPTNNCFKNIQLIVNIAACVLTGMGFIEMFLRMNITTV